MIYFKESPFFYSIFFLFIVIVSFLLSFPLANAYAEINALGIQTLVVLAIIFGISFPFLRSTRPISLIKGEVWATTGLFISLVLDILFNPGAERGLGYPFAVLMFWILILFVFLILWFIEKRRSSVFIIVIFLLGLSFLIVFPIYDLLNQCDRSRENNFQNLESEFYNNLSRQFCS